ncbi:threonine dehydratase I [Gyrodon lividus]|nr:threonine dehydratase I [Gyrodon lividus]
MSVAAAARLVEYASNAPLRIKNYPLPPGALLASGEPNYLQLIQEAATLLEQVKPLPLTPLFYAPVLSEKLKCKIFLKREDLQPVFSFKIRGAFNCMSNLSPEEREKGVITASAGNHAQGVAYSSNRLGVQSMIYMPTNTPEIKVSSVQRLGGEHVTIKLFGDDFNAAKEEAIKVSKETGMKFVSPYDDDFVIAGQGTIALEIVNQLKAAKEAGTIVQDYADGIFAPVGGGGLISGITAYIKLSGETRTQTYAAGGIGSRSMYESLKAGHVVEVSTVDLFPDGTAVARVGDLTFALCNKYLTLENLYNDITTDELCAAIEDIFDETRSIAEPSGALGLAALKQHVFKHKPSQDQVFVVVISGANMDFETLRFVSENAALGARKEAFLSVKFDDPLNKFPRIIDLVQTRPSGASRNITELVFRHNSPGNGHAVFSFIISPDQSFQDQTTEMIQQLGQSNFVGADLIDNSLARNHVRYMVGGRSEVELEQLVSFTFPERPGSLMKFLDLLDTANQPLPALASLSLTLFHYRFYGGDVVNVLVGIQVPLGSEAAFQKFLEELLDNGYASVIQTGDQLAAAPTRTRNTQDEVRPLRLALTGGPGPYTRSTYIFILQSIASLLQFRTVGRVISVLSHLSRSPLESEWPGPSSAYSASHPRFIEIPRLLLTFYRDHDEPMEQSNEHFSFLVNEQPFSLLKSIEP